MTDYSRISGIVSGLDTTNVVKNMLKGDQAKIDKLKAEKQKRLWKQESYREIGTLLKGLQTKNFDLLNRDTDMRRRANYISHEAKVSVYGEKSNTVSVRATDLAGFKNFTIDSISKLATKERWTASKKINEISGDVNIERLNAALSKNTENKFTLNVDGKTKTVLLKNEYASVDEYRSDLKQKIENAFGEGVVNVTGTGDRIEIDGNLHKIKLAGNDSSITSAMQMRDGDTNYFDKSASYSQLFGVSGEIELNINGFKPIKFSAGNSIEDIMKKINNSTVSVRMSLDPISGRFSLEHRETGSVNEIKFDDEKTKQFFERLGLTEDVKVRGEDADFVINGKRVVDSSNTINMGGAEIKLNAVHDANQGKIEVETQYNSDKIKENMKEFIKKYNAIVDKVNGLTTQRRQFQYKPLTKEEKNELKDDEIEKWTEKAKQGNMRGDAILNKILSDMRKIITYKVDGVSVTARDAGIKFTKNFRDGGKLEFDEAKFDKTMKERPEELVNFFTNEAEVPFDSGKVEERFSKNGFMHRLNDIIRLNTSTSPFKNKKRGHLVEKAGFKDTSSDVTNEIATGIRKIDRRIDYMIEQLRRKENSFFYKFSRLEQAMNKYQAQGQSFTNLISG